jgi:hypothetical protein
MPKVTDIDGIGPTTANKLEDLGYESVEDIANGDPDDISEIDQVTEDRALEFIVVAEDLLSDESEDDNSEDEDFDLAPADVSDEVEQEEDDEPEEIEADDADEEDDTEPESEEQETYEVQLSFESKLQYDTFHASLMRYHEAIYNGNQPSADAIKYCLDELDSFDSVEYELEEFELNTLHTAVKQARSGYQGDNLIEHMDALQEVENQIDDARREHLF